MRLTILGPRAAGALLAAVACLPAARVGARPLTIDDAVALALQTNPRLAAARERMRASDEGETAAGRRMLPSIHVSEELQRYNAPFAIAFAFPGVTAPPFTVRDQTTNTFVASADQPLLGLLRADRERASLAEQTAATQAGLAAAEADVRADVETQYLRVFEAQALEQIATSSVQELGDQVTVAKARLASGVITNADLLRIEVAVANAQQQGLEAHGQAQIARAQLYAAIGIQGADAADVTLVEPAARLATARASQARLDAAGLQATARVRRPELAQQGHVVLAADSQARAGAYALLPDVDLEAAYLRLYGQPFQPINSAYFGVKAQWAIWEWGASEHQRRAAAAQAAAARRDQEALERQVDAEVDTSVAQGESARGAVDTAEKAITSAEEAFRVTNAAVKAGAATTTDLLESEAALTQARLNLTRAQYELVLAGVALARASGG